MSNSQIMEWIHLNGFNYSHSFRLQGPAGLERKVWPSPLCQMRLTPALWMMFRTGLRWTSANFQRRLTSHRTVSVNIQSLQDGFKGINHKNIKFSYDLFTLIKKKVNHKRYFDISRLLVWKWMEIGAVEVQNENICKRGNQIMTEF